MFFFFCTELQEDLLKLRKRIILLRQQLRREKEKLKKRRVITTKQAVEHLKAVTPQSFHSLLDMHVRLGKRSPRGRRYSNTEKTLALSLFQSSPSTYRLLRKLFLLPSPSTLKASLRKLNLQTGFNDDILKSLEAKVKGLPEEDRICILTYDEMTMKEFLQYDQSRDAIFGFEDLGNLGKTKYVANHASVYMVRSIRGKWKQPVGYFFTSGTMKRTQMKDTLYECLDRLKTIGLDVKAFVCDQGSNNRSLVNFLGVSEEKPYFIYKTKKYFVLYDPPHLIKNVRNNFHLHGFYHDKDEIEWGCIREFYDLDTSNCELRTASKLKDKHIYLPPFTKMKVKLATQVLSNSVASGMQFYLDAGLMTCAHTKPTIKFVKFFDKLFDTFNSTSQFSDHEFRVALSDKSPHWAFWEEAKTYLKNLTSRADKKYLPCIKGWVLNINAMKALYKELGFSYLFTGRINQVRPGYHSCCIVQLYYFSLQSLEKKIFPNTDMLYIFFHIIFLFFRYWFLRMLASIPICFFIQL